MLSYEAEVKCQAYSIPKWVNNSEKRILEDPSGSVRVLVSLSIRCRVTDDTTSVSQGSPNSFSDRSHYKKISIFVLFCGRRNLLLRTAVNNSLLALQNYGFLTVIQKTSPE